MSRSISDVEKDSLLRNAGITERMTVQQLMPEIIMRDQSPGFAADAMRNKESLNYVWAHTTPRGIIWLWLQQTPEIQAQWLRDPQSQWQNFPHSPSPSQGSPIPFGASESQANPLGYYTPGTGAVSVPASSATSSSFLSRLGTSSSSITPTASPFFFGSSSDSGPVSVPTTPQASSSSNDGGYRKRRTRKTRRKSNRRGKSRSRSRSHQIRRKKTHHRRHRR